METRVVVATEVQKEAEGTVEGAWVAEAMALEVATVEAATEVAGAGEVGMVRVAVDRVAARGEAVVSGRVVTPEAATEVCLARVEASREEMLVVLRAARRAGTMEPPSRRTCQAAQSPKPALMGREAAARAVVTTAAVVRVTEIRRRPLFGSQCHHSIILNRLRA